jgi:hypothetical protein
MTEMTIGRTDAWVMPLSSVAFEVAILFGNPARISSGPAVHVPHQKAGHMNASMPLSSVKTLALTGPSTHEEKGCPPG